MFPCGQSKRTLHFCTHAVRQHRLTARTLCWGGDIAQLVELWISMLPTQVRLPGMARDFPPRVNFQCRLSYGVRTPLVCNRMHLFLCAGSRSRSPCQSLVDYGNTETTSMHCRLGRFCHSWLSLGKATRISHSRNPTGTIQL